MCRIQAERALTEEEAQMRGCGGIRVVLAVQLILQAPVQYKEAPAQQKLDEDAEAGGAFQQFKFVCSASPLIQCCSKHS